MWEMPEEIAGISVVLDTFAATTNIATLLNASPNNITVVNESTLYEQITKTPEPLIVGESTILPLSTFHCSNAPYMVSQLAATGRNIIYMSINGTKAIERCISRTRNEVITGAFVNIGSVVNYLREKNQPVALIMSGDDGHEVEEDRLCADTIISMVNGQEVSWDDNRKRISDFIGTFYGITPPNKNIDVVLEIDTKPVVPLCSQSSLGIIDIRNAS